jgi:glycosyltransferase involved in cell wall biosynthesis
LLYKGEKWIYKKADAVVMTWEGGKDYIVERGWDKEIPIEKIRYIPNGVALDAFDKNCIDYPINDSDLDDKDYCNVVYTGSIRKVNNLGVLLDAAKIIWEQGHTKIRFLIYGSGNETEMLIRRCEEEKIDNVKFKGRVDKKFVPSILTQANVNVLHNSSTSLDKYGQSQNKLFEYLAAGKCIVQTYSTGYSVCDRYECGISASEQNAEEIAKVVIKACMDKEKNQIMGINARKAAYDFDFTKLTGKLINVIESV